MELVQPRRSTPPGADRSPSPLAAITRAEALFDGVRDLATAGDLATIRRVVHRATRQLTGADGTTFLVGGAAGVSAVGDVGDVGDGHLDELASYLGDLAMSHCHTLAIADLAADERIPAEVARRTRARSLLMVPVRSHDPVGVIVASWEHHHEMAGTEISVLQALADSTAMALDKLLLTDALEARVAERTAELIATNRRLDSEIRERARAEEQHRILAFTDDLTGLYNRRGFTHLTGEIRRAERPSIGVEQLVFVDIDGLKAVNDTLGHHEGDRLLRSAATVLRETFGDEDVLARIGGDEFAVYQPRPTMEPARIVERIEAATKRHNRRGALAGRLAVSIGVATAGPNDGESLDRLLARSDAAMYAHRRVKHRSTVGLDRFRVAFAPAAELV